MQRSPEYTLELKPAYTQYWAKTNVETKERTRPILAANIFGPALIKFIGKEK
jgi:hypothetical protein